MVERKPEGKPSGPLSKIIIMPPRIRQSTKRCLPCRMRHVRCDGAVPSCNNCKNKQIHCPGYPNKPLKWVSVGQGATDTKSQAAPSCTVSANHGVKIDDIKPRTASPQPGVVDQLISTRSFEQIPTSRLLGYLDQLQSEELWLTHQRHDRCVSFIDYYINNVAPMMSIFDNPSNPFSGTLTSYVSQSMALTHTIIAMSTIHMAFTTEHAVLYSQGLKYRTVAISLLREELHTAPLEIATFTTIVLLGITESWFNHDSCGIIHLEGARALLNAPRASSQRIPRFIYNAFRWWETLAAFVHDYDGSNTDISAFPENIWTKTPHNDNRSPSPTKPLTAIDPTLGTWDDLFPFVGQVAVIARRLQRFGPSTALNDLVVSIETSLLEWQPSTSPGEPSRKENNTRDCLEYHAMAEAYRQSALITLYRACPNLLSIRASLLPDDVAAVDFMRSLSSSVISLLEQIDSQSSVLHVCSFPVLAAGQYVHDAYQREVVQNILRKLLEKNKITIIGKLSNLLQEVWKRRDGGQDIGWLDILHESGSEMLIN